MVQATQQLLASLHLGQNQRLQLFNLQASEQILQCSEQQEQLPANPAGLVELNDEDMSSVSGGCTTCGNPLHTLFWTCKAVSSRFDTIA